MRQLYCVLSIAISLGAVGCAAAGKAPASQPARSTEQLLQELNVQTAALVNALPEDLIEMKDSARRAEAGKTIIPIVRKALAVIDQLPPNCRGESMSPMGTSWEPLLVVFGDEDHTRRLHEQAAGTGEEALNAQLCLAMADSILALDDTEKAEASIRRIVELASRAPASEQATMALFAAREDERISPQLRQLVQSTLDDATSGVALTLRSLPTTLPSE